MSFYPDERNSIGGTLGAICRPEDVLKGRRGILEGAARDLDPGQLEKGEGTFQEVG
ncbi:MAG: hypothetical protein QXG38_00640 [Candidatus Hadarchaeales archaeon]